MYVGVISLDLAWSEAVENQAWARAHRLGQNKHVFVERLVIENTVEDRILGLQKEKVRSRRFSFLRTCPDAICPISQMALADGSLGEGSGKKIGRECSHSALLVRDLNLV